MNFQTEIDRNLLVLYGSQTGTAIDVGERIRREAYRRHFHVAVRSLDNAYTNIRIPLLIMVCATTGQGDTPDNMKKFWRFIMRKSIAHDNFDGLSYIVIGLGDSQYEKFNYVAKKLFKRMKMLGAIPLLPLCLTDESHDLGHNAELTPFLERMWLELGKQFPLGNNVVEMPPDAIMPSKFIITRQDRESCGLQNVSNDGGSDKHSDYGFQSPYYSTLLSNARVTANDHWQDVRLVQLDIANSGISYKPGDVVMILAQNKPEQVDSFLSALRLNGDDMVNVVPRSTDEESLPGLITPCSLRHLVTHHLDLHSRPRDYFWELLSQFTDSDLEREKLVEFRSPEGQEELYAYCHRPRRTLLECLVDFPRAATRIPLDYLLDLAPPPQPRAFSIASAQKATPDEIQIIVAVVNYKSTLVEPRTGFCTSWLTSLRQNIDKVPIWVRPGTVTFPTEDNATIIMVGPGTGCAPFRSYIQDRFCVGHDEKIKSQDVTLYFGCRNRDKDYHFQSEWEGFVQAGLMTLHTAFSREVPSCYVQDKVEENGAELWRLLSEKNAFFYVAGNAKRMPDGVRSAVTSVIIRHGHMSEAEAGRFLLNMERTGRYQTETWH